jgi:hypothetical protein
MKRKRWAPPFTPSPKRYWRDSVRLTEERMRQAGLFGLSDHLKRFSAFGDPLEELARIVDFEVFRPALVAALA